MPINANDLSLLTAAESAAYAAKYGAGTKAQRKAFAAAIAAKKAGEPTELDVVFETPIAIHGFTNNGKPVVHYKAFGLAI